MRWLLSALVICVVAFAAYLYSGHWHPSRDAFPEQGIDVSHHQGKIEWQKLRAQGVDFSYIKSTEGGDFRDKRFSENWQGAAQAGITRGAYHFFTLCRSGKEQAANFISVVPTGVENLPPVVDLEFLGNCSKSPKKLDFDRELSDFIIAVESHYGQKIILYLTEEFDRKYTVSDKFDRRLWLRSLVREPSFGARQWYIWQVSNFRRLDGIQGRVDWNVKTPDDAQSAAG